jgi:hypothetical protein
MNVQAVKALATVFKEEQYIGWMEIPLTSDATQAIINLKGALVNNFEVHLFPDTVENREEYSVFLQDELRVEFNES